MIFRKMRGGGGAKDRLELFRKFIRFGRERRPLARQVLLYSSFSPFEAVGAGSPLVPLGTPFKTPNTGAQLSEAQLSGAWSSEARSICHYWFAVFLQAAGSLWCFKLFLILLFVNGFLEAPRQWWGQAGMEMAEGDRPGGTCTCLHLHT